MINSPAESDFAAAVAADVVGQENVDPQAPALMGSEDFAYMLQAKPAATSGSATGWKAGRAVARCTIRCTISTTRSR